MARVPEAEGALNVSHGKIKYALVSLLVSHVLCACLSLHDGLTDRDHLELTFRFSQAARLMSSIRAIMPHGSPPCPCAVTDKARRVNGDHESPAQMCKLRCKRIN